MIIDLILDRKGWEEDGYNAYKPHDFYMNVMRYGEIGDDITRAMDFGTEADVRRELCNYVLRNGYNPAICKYINRKTWLTRI